MKVEIAVDEDCDGFTDSTLTTSTYNDSYNPTLTSGNILYFDIEDDATSICYQIDLYEVDLGGDQLLDYVSGSGSSYYFTLSNLSSTTSVTYSYDNTASSESYRAGFEMDVSIY